MHAAPSLRGIPQVSQEDRPRNPPQSRSPPDRRQLLHAQDAAVQRWLKRHPRFKLHFIPTSSSWLNLVERLFAEITRQQIRRGVFHNVSELEEAIVRWINHRNANPKPFVWTATPRSITLKRNRAKKTLANLAAGRK